MEQGTEKKTPPMVAILLSICTAALVGCFVFAWDTNANITLLLDHDRTKSEVQDKQQADINKIHLDIFDVKERVTTLETRQNYQHKK